MRIIADFAWNCYGNAPFCEEIDYERGDISNDLAKQMGLEIKSSDIVCEGGGLESNSTVIIAFEKFAKHRNPNKSMKEIEKGYLKMYGKEKREYELEFGEMRKMKLIVDQYFNMTTGAKIFYKEK